MSVSLLQSGTNPFAQDAAYAFGMVAVLITLAAWAWQRRAGPTADERRHSKSIETSLTQLSRVHPIYLNQYPAVEDVWRQVNTRLGSQIPMSRYRAVLTRLRALVSGQVIRCLRATDADGQPIFLVSVGGLLLAHRDRDELKADTLTVLRAMRVGDDPPATMSEWYARDIKDGRVDLQRSIDRARGDCELRLEENLKREGELDIKQLYHRLVHDDGFRYPPEVVGSKLDQLLDRDVRLHRDGTLRYQRY